MRKLVVTEFVSLDGVMEAPGGDDGYVHGAWTMPFWGDEIAEFKTAEMVPADALLLGRVTYQGFAGRVAERSAGRVQRQDELDGEVRRQQDARVGAWNNSTILRGDMVATSTR